MPKDVIPRLLKGKQPRAKSLRGRASKPAPGVRDALAVELYALMNIALARFGLSASDRQTAFEKSRGLTKAPTVSGPLLRDFRGLCSLLLEWSREPDYLVADGKPRVLDVAGAGATFETLASRFLPNQRLSDVIAMACATAEVTLRRGGRIALLGSVLVNVANSTDNLLAHAIRQIDQLLETILHNKSVRRNGSSNGHLERMVTGVIARSEFAHFMSELKPQIYDLLQRVDSSVHQRQPKSEQSLREATAVSVGIYVSREEDWERAGIDAGVLVKSHRRRKSAPSRRLKR